MMNISTNEFKANKTEALAFIANALRKYASYEDGQYYFHFTDDGSTITAFDSYHKAESTVTATISVEDMCDAAGINHDTDMGDILVNFEDTEKFNDVVEEIYDAVIEEID